MALQKSDYEAMLKIDYHGPMVDLLENSTFFLSRAERYVEPTGGKFFYIPLRKGRTSSIGARNDGTTEALPVGATPAWDAATFTAKSLYATIRITGFSMRTSARSQDAFERALTSDMELTVTDMKKDLNRQIFGDGSAELARIASIATNTLTLVHHLYPTWPNKFLYVNEIVDARTIASGAVATGGITGDSVTLTAISGTATVAFTGSAFTVTATSMALYREDNMNTTAPKEIYGLVAALYNVNPSSAAIPPGTTSYGTRLTANYGNIDRSTNTWWQGNVLANAGTLRPFSVSLVAAGIDEAEIKGGGKISIIQTNHSIYRVYGNTLAAAKQFDGAVMKMDGGWTALDCMGIPMFKDTECPDYHMFLIDETTMMLGVVGDWAWIEGDGGSILTRITGYDQYEGVFNRDCQLICNAPNKNCVIADVAHS